MKKTVVALTATAVTSGLVIAANPAQAMDIERERSKMCSGTAFATLSLEKEFNRIDVDADLENATPGRSWTVRVKHNGSTILRTARVADYEGELEVAQQVADRAGTDRLTARFSGPNGERCTIKLSI